MPLRCLIVDDSRSFLTAARSLLELQGILVVAVCTTGAEALVNTSSSHPDVAVVDVMLGHESGVQLAQQLHAAGCAVVMTSTHDMADIEELLSGSPAVGFIAKSELSADALHRVLNLPPASGDA